MKATRLLPVLALAAAAAVAASGFGARFGLWHFGIGFQILRWGAYASLAIAAIALVACLIPRLRAGAAANLGAALVVGLGTGALPLTWMQQARALPAINDITTDTANPPEYVAIVPLRADARVPVAYSGDSTAQAQRLAYPDIKTVVVSAMPEAAFATALSAAQRMDWDIVAVNPAAGRIEATATTPWFGFKDDIVIRVAPAANGSRIDIRSHSRLGKGDLGANAARVRAYVAVLGT